MEPLDQGRLILGSAGPPKQGLCLLLAASLLFAGCENLDEGVASTHTDDLYVLSTTTWEPGSVIDVCFDSNVAGSDRTAALVGARVWESLANISFADVGTCPGSGFSGIWITGGDEMVVRGGLGEQADGISDMEIDTRSGVEGLYGVCTVDSLSRADCIARICVHEFGHSLAFAHEQNRPDNFGQCSIGVGSGSHGDTTYGEFDVDSVMSYCSNLRELTWADRRGAVAVYGIAPSLMTSML
ncbi:MAG TPA: hypothetical protein VJN18_06760 [Polyangiaceae bacterium]|nr:hypothetical protein [Polyangiaceae bacterium]